MLLAQKPDSRLRKFSRDYDSVFLLAPFTLLAAFIAYMAPLTSNYVWIAVMTSGVSAMFLCERMNRQHRSHFGAQWGIQVDFDLIGFGGDPVIAGVIWPNRIDDSIAIADMQLATVELA